MGQKARDIQSSGSKMSRTALLFLILLVLIIGGAVYLSTLDTEVPPTRIKQDVTNEALAQ